MFWKCPLRQLITELRFVRWPFPLFSYNAVTGASICVLILSFIVGTLAICLFRHIEIGKIVLPPEKG